MLNSLDGVLLLDAGAREQYSNLGFALLGSVIDRVSDLGYEEHVSERVLKPLGMLDTAWDDEAYAADRVALAYARDPNGLVTRPFSRRGARLASGGLFSTVPDMARFVAIHLDAWPPRSAAETGPLRRATLREGHVGETLPRLIARPTPTAQGWSPVVAATGHAWGVRVDCEHEHLLTHTGGLDGHVSMVLLLPGHGLGLILLASATSLEPAAVTYEALDILAANGLPARQHHPSDALLSSVDRLIPLLAEFDAGEFERLFAWYLHDAIDGFRQVTSKLSNRVGTCRDYELVEASNPFAGRFVLKCDRGDIHLDIELPRNLPARIGYARMGIAGGPAPESVDIVAKRSLRLLRRFDDRTFRSTFADSFDPRGLERFMGVVRSQLGSCRMASVEAHTDTSARYALACEYGAATLELEVPAEGRRIAAYRIVPRRSTRPCAP